MEFVTLNQAIALMVRFGGYPATLKFLDAEVREYRPGYQDSESTYRLYCHRSYMAGYLHQLITNAPNAAAFRWARQHPITGRAVVDQSVATEALDQLARMGAYVYDEYNAAVKLGPGGLRMEKSRVVRYPDPRVKLFMPRVDSYAMVGSDLIRILEWAGIVIFPGAGGADVVPGASGASIGSGVDAPRAQDERPNRVQSEAQERRQERRYRMCVDAGLKMPSDDYASLPRGINKLAEKEAITRQAFAEDVKAHIRRINGR